MSSDERMNEGMKEGVNEWMNEKRKKEMNEWTKYLFRLLIVLTQVIWPNLGLEHMPILEPVRAQHAPVQASLKVQFCIRQFVIFVRGDKSSVI